MEDGVSGGPVDAGCVHRSDCITQPISINQVTDRDDQSWTGSNRPVAACGDCPVGVQ